MNPSAIDKLRHKLRCGLPIDGDGVTGTTLTIDGGYLAAAEWATKGDRRSDIPEASPR